MRLPPHLTHTQLADFLATSQLKRLARVARSAALGRMSFVAGRICKPNAPLAASSECRGRQHSATQRHWVPVAAGLAAAIRLWRMRRAHLTQLSWRITVRLVSRAATTMSAPQPEDIGAQLSVRSFAVSSLAGGPISTISGAQCCRRVARKLAAPLEPHAACAIDCAARSAAG